jgi:hypothetical protein
MSTYYGFNEREKLKPIDWNSITRDINQKIDTEIERRDTIKKEIDEFGAEYRKKLNEAPMGDSNTINNWVSESAGQLGDNFKMIDDQLKSGRLKYKDYIRLRGNMNEGVDTMIALANNANAIYSEKYDRMEMDESQVLEQFLMDKTLALADFANSAPVIDPETGVFSLARRDEKGNIIPGSIISMTNLRKMASWKGNKFDVNTWVDDTVEKAANTKFQAFRDAPFDLRTNENYQEWLDDTAKSLNPYQQAEVLTRVGDYEFTDSKAVRDSDPDRYILMDGMRDGVPNLQFTDDQKEDVENILKRSIDMRMDRYFGGLTTRRPLSDTRSGRGEKVRRYSILDVAITGGDTSALEDAITKEYGKNNTNVDVTVLPGDKVVITYEDINTQDQIEEINLKGITTYEGVLNSGLGAAIGLSQTSIGTENQAGLGDFTYDPFEGEREFDAVQITSDDYAALPKSLGSTSGVKRTMAGRIFNPGDLRPAKIDAAVEAIDAIIARTKRKRGVDYTLSKDDDNNIVIEAGGKSFLINTRSTESQQEEFMDFVNAI